MSRSGITSPLSNNFLCECINTMWNKGWLNEFSEDHFLIRAIQNDVNYFKNYLQMQIVNANLFDYDKNFGLNFAINFSNRFQRLINVFGEKDMERFTKDQLSAGKTNYCEDQFFRALSEINVLQYLSTYGPDRLKDAIYEPPIGGNGANPEARLIYFNDIIVDVEVKTPGFNVPTLSKNTIIPNILLNDTGRTELNKYCIDNDINCIWPRINKLKDFINSASDKFMHPTSNRHVNLLFINWTYTEFLMMGYFEPCSLLLNEKNGIFLYKDIAIRMGIKEEAFEKITAIIIYQDSLNSLLFQDFRYLWSTKCFAMLPNTNLPNNLLDIDLLLQITGMNPEDKENHHFPELMFDFEKDELESKVIDINNIIAKSYLK